MSVRDLTADEQQRFGPAPICNCNAGPAGWIYPKGTGPDPARCPVHGDAAREHPHAEEGGR